MKKLFKLNLIVPFLFFIFSFQSLGSPSDQLPCVESNLNRRLELNQRVERINSEPANIAFATEYPASFTQIVKDRFELQKRTHPSRPYGFPMPELAHTLAFMKDSLEEGLLHYNLGKGVVWRDSDQEALRLYDSLGLKALKKRYYNEARAEREFIREVLNDLKKVDPKNPPYDDIINLSYWQTRVMALSSDLKQPWKMLIEQFLQSSSIGRATHELRNYRNGALAYIPKMNLMNKGFIYTDRNEIFDPDHLNMVLLPAVKAMEDKSVHMDRPFF